MTVVFQSEETTVGRHENGKGLLEYHLNFCFNITHRRGKILKVGNAGLSHEGLMLSIADETGLTQTWEYAQEFHVALKRTHPKANLSSRKHNSSV